MSDVVRKTMPSGEPFIINYLHSKAREMGIPASVSFEITSRCNFNCKMCYIHSEDCNKRASEELTAEQWIDIARQARDAGAVLVLITGGEPLMRKDFPQIFSSMKKMGLFVSINTNASLITGEMAEFFKNDPPARLNISLYGASNETYRRLCGGDYFDIVYKNIKNMVDSGIQVKLNMSITPYNCGDLKDMLKIAADLGVQSKVTTYMYPPVRRNDGLIGENPARFTADEAAFWRAEYDVMRFGKEEFLKRAEELERGCLNDCESCFDLSRADGEQMQCRAGSSGCWVNYKGKMNACGMFSVGDYDVLDGGFQTCWEKVKRSAEAIKTPAECVECSYKNLCPMCAAVCKSETGEFNKTSDYVCEFSKASKKYILELAERIKNEA